MGGFAVEGFFVFRLSLFSTLTANYGPLLIFSTAFDWLPSSIMSSAPEINKFSTRHPKSTPKVPLNMGPENT